RAQQDEPRAPADAGPPSSSPSHLAPPASSVLVLIADDLRAAWIGNPGPSKTLENLYFSSVAHGSPLSIRPAPNLVGKCDRPHRHRGGHSRLPPKCGVFPVRFFPCRPGPRRPPDWARRPT